MTGAGRRGLDGHIVRGSGGSRVDCSLGVGVRLVVVVNGEVWRALMGLGSAAWANTEKGAKDRLAV